MSCIDSIVLEHDGNPECIKLLYISGELDIDMCDSICFSKIDDDPNDKIVVLPHLHNGGTFFAFGDDGRLKIARWMLPKGFKIVKVD